MTLDDRARELLELYDRDIRPLLTEHRVASLDALDQTRDVLQTALATSDRLSVGFVGASQVGKSSIINALLGQRVVPAGGLGPLTAQATHIGYRDVSSLEVRYHGGDQLNRLGLGIASYLKKRGELEGSEVEAPDAVADVEAMLDFDMAEDAIAPEETERRRPSKVGEHMLSQVQLMLRRPDDDRDVARAIRNLPRPALLDAVRLMLEQAPLGPLDALDPYQARIAEVRRVLGRTENIEERDDGHTEFRKELHLRAAGWLSPLVAKLHLHIRQPLLKDVDIVDLPGVGNVADPGATVAAQFVGGKSSGALVVVFRNAGITEDVVNILDRSGVFTRLLWGGKGGRPAIRIIVAVTYVDQVAQERFGEMAADGFEPPDPDELFSELAAEMTEKIRDDLRRALEDSHAYADASGRLKDSEAAVRDALANAIDVMVVDAKDYLQIIEQQQIGRFLSDEATTNVPQLRQRIRAVGQQSVEDRAEAIHSSYSELHGSLSEAVGVLGNLYESGSGRATSDWARFRDALTAAVGPVRREMTAGREKASVELRDDLPAVLDEICSEAEENALKKLKSLRRRGEKLYWPSLNAALQRGGTWDKQRLDYPGSLTRALVDTIAAAWEPQVVESVRTTVRDLANEEIELVERVCSAARDIDEDLTVEAQVDAQKKILRQQARSCIRWTNNRLEGLRDDIQENLKDVVKEPIEAACKRARDRRKHRGKGATTKILDAFETGGAAAIGEASKDAKRLLRKHYKSLLKELEAGYLKEHHDPVTAAVEALIGEEHDRAKEADDEARKAVLRRAKSIARDLSELTPEKGVAA